MLIFLLRYSANQNNNIYLKLCLQTAKRVYKKQKKVYDCVNFLFNQVSEKVMFLEDQVYALGRFKKLAHTPALKLPPSYPPPQEVVNLGQV